LGEVVGDLSRRGLTDVSFNLVTSERAFQRNRKSEVPSQDVLAEWIKDHPTFKAIEAVRYFEEQGRSKSAAYPALGVLIEKGVLKKMGEGMYARSDVKALPAPKGKKAKAVKTHTKVQHEVPGPDFALRAMSRAHGRISSGALKRLFEKDGRSPTGTGPVLTKLVGQKKIKSVGDGMYELIKAAPKKTNGAAVEVPATGA
jgi:hypothetical protein